MLLNSMRLLVLAQLGSDTQHYCKAPGDIGLGLFLEGKKLLPFLPCRYRLRRKKQSGNSASHLNFLFLG